MCKVNLLFLHSMDFPGKQNKHNSKMLSQAPPLLPSLTGTHLFVFWPFFLFFISNVKEYL